VCVYDSGNSLAEPTHARLFPSFELLSVAAGGHAGRCHQLSWIYMGEWIFMERVSQHQSSLSRSRLQIGRNAKYNLAPIQILMWQNLIPPLVFYLKKSISFAICCIIFVWQWLKVKNKVWENSTFLDSSAVKFRWILYDMSVWRVLNITLPIFSGEKLQGDIISPLEPIKLSVFP